MVVGGMVVVAVVVVGGDSFLGGMVGSVGLCVWM